MTETPETNNRRILIGHLWTHSRWGYASKIYIHLNNPFPAGEYRLKELIPTWWPNAETKSRVIYRYLNQMHKLGLVHLSGSTHQRSVSRNSLDPDTQALLQRLIQQDLNIWFTDFPKE
jgi:hypothetical protein